jgi:hypothetical protein
MTESQSTRRVDGESVFKREPGLWHTRRQQPPLDAVDWFPAPRHPALQVAAPPAEPHAFSLQRVQPALSGLMDGSLSTLAPIFAVVFATHRPLTAFYTGLATAVGSGVSMAFSEGLSDTGEETGRGSPLTRSAITGGGTFAGGVSTPAVPHPALSSSARSGGDHRDDRVVGSGLAAPPVFPHEFPALLSLCHRRRDDDRHRQRRAWRGSWLNGKASTGYHRRRHLIPQLLIMILRAGGPREAERSQL